MAKQSVQMLRAATHSHSPLAGGTAPGDGGIGHDVGDVGSHLHHVHGDAQGMGHRLGNLWAKHASNIMSAGLGFHASSVFSFILPLASFV